MQPESHFDDSSIKNLIERMKGACMVKPESISETTKDSSMTSTSLGGTYSLYGLSPRKVEHTFHDNATQSSSATENSSCYQFTRNKMDIRNEIGIDHDCMACIISSHGLEKDTESNGRQHEISTKDSTVLTKDILNNFADDKCENLKGKPKMFFI
ncbi:uncharacterized protein LOC134713936 isoform X2 [Mytilus trossulus]|uniref:uncharacterized protein LOC134713936 isoform X2 n=1 Tax=Mytilus trossulus TaxID=6551 RepID=UPI003007D2B5